MREIACEPSAPGRTVRELRTYLRADGLPAERTDALLEAHGVLLDADADDRLVPIDVCWRIFSEHAVLIDDEMHGVFSTRLKPGGTGLIVARMLICETIFEALCAYAEASAICVPDLPVSVGRCRDGVSLRWRSPDAQSELHQIVLEGTAVIYFAIFCWLAGDVLDVVRVRAPAARRNAGSTLLNAMGAPVAYGGDDLEIVFAPGAAAAAICQRDIGAWRDGAYKMLSTFAIRPRPGANSGAFTNKVRSALLDGADQQSVARRWGVSSKTLARKLEREGCSFRSIRDEVLMHKSSSLIHSGHTVEEIGEMVGYEDTRSFRRAFRRWFGVSPSAYRTRRQAI